MKSRSVFHAVAMQAIKYYKEVEKERIKRELVVLDESKDSSARKKF